jgi:hypothetical protein
MKLLESDVAIITILTLLLFSLVRFQDAWAAGSTAAQTPTDKPIEWVP